MFSQSLASFYKHHTPQTFKNYQIWACGCSVQILSDNEKTRQMGIHKNRFESTTSPKISAYFDIFFKIIARLEPATNAGPICCAAWGIR